MATSIPTRSGTTRTRAKRPSRSRAALRSGRASRWSRCWPPSRFAPAPKGRRPPLGRPGGRPGLERPARCAHWVVNTVLTVVHRRRLREMWRSAGWPCHDMVEVELLAEGWLERVRCPAGHETLRVTDAGVAVLAETLQRNRATRDAHEALVERVAREMTRAGRLAWRGLALRAKVDSGWAMAMPDVFSIRHTTVEAYAEPIVHEVKVQRADLLADLRRACKRQAS